MPTLSFEEFVTDFWNKKHRNGNPWTLQEIALETGEYPDTIRAYSQYCFDKGSLTDAQLIALDPEVTMTPFGVKIKDKTTHVPIPPDEVLNKLVGSVTVSELIQAIKSSM
jgi:hypothetical protein